MSGSRVPREAPRDGAPDATPLVLPAALASGSLIAQHVAGRATRDSLFLSHFGIGLLPAAMIAAALISSLAMVGMSRTLTRRGPGRVVPVAFAISATVHLGEALLATRFEPVVAVTIYVHSALFGAAAVSAFWSLVNERFDPREAKRAVGRIAAGGTVGGVVGGLVVWRAANVLPVPAMLAFLSLMNVVGFGGSLRLATRGRGPRRPSRAASTTAPSRAPAESGLRALRDTPYLRDLALLVLAGAVLQALLDWLLSARAARIYDKGELLGFFALFNMIVGVASFIAQTGLSRVLLERLGLGGTVRLQPLVTAAFGVIALLATGPASIFVLRGAEAVSRNSFFRSAYELFYTPLPPAKKRPTKQLIDVGFDRLGTTLGSGALLVVATLPTETATRIVLVAALLAAGVAIVIGSRLQEGYVTALADSLKTGAVALGDDDLMDLTTRRTLAETTALLDRDKLLARIEEFQRERETSGASVPPSSLAPSGPPSDAPPPVEEAPRSRRSLVPLPPLDASAIERDALLLRAAALRSGDPLRVRAELAQPLPPELAAFVVPLLATDAVARDAVRALRRAAPSIAGLLVDRLLDPKSDVKVRRRLPRVLRSCESELATRGLLAALRDPAFEVRTQAGLALSEMAERPGMSFDREAVFDIAVHELTEARATWGADTARGVSHVFVVLGLVLEREPLAIALRALRGDDAALRGTAHEYLDVVLPPRVLTPLSPLLGVVEKAARTRAAHELEGELLRSHARLPSLRGT